MKLSILTLVALAAMVAAAPVPAPVPAAEPAAEPEAAPGYGQYGGYGTYAPPKGGYGKYSGYGSYKRVEDKVEKRDYGDYGSYPPPAGGVSRPLYNVGESNINTILIVRRLWKLWKCSSP
jgi:hypothetical protein